MLFDRAAADYRDVEIPVTYYGSGGTVGEKADGELFQRVMVKENLNWRSFVDTGVIGNKWKPAGTPSFFVIDPKGVIRNNRCGAGETDPRDDGQREGCAKVVRCLVRWKRWGRGLTLLPSVGSVWT